MDNPNQTIQGLSPTPTVPPLVQTPPVLKPKSKLPFLIIGIILFLLIAGSAAGFYIYKQNSKTTPKLTLAPSPAEVSTKVGTPDPTTNWKMYSGNGFTLKYPSDFAPEKCPQNLNSNLCSDKLDNSIEPLYYFLSFSNEPTLPDTTGFSGVKTNYKEEIINGTIVERTTDLPSQSGAEDVFFKKPSGGYVLIGFSPYDYNKKFPQQDKYYSLFNQTLSTFKFTN